MARDEQDQEIVRVEEHPGNPHWVTGERTPYIEIHTEEAQITVWPGFVYVETVSLEEGYPQDDQANIGPKAIEALIAAWRKFNPSPSAPDAGERPTDGVAPAE